MNSFYDLKFNIQAYITNIKVEFVDKNGKGGPKNHPREMFAEIEVKNTDFYVFLYEFLNRISLNIVHIYNHK